MRRRDFVRAVLAVGAAPKLLLSQQAAIPAPPPPAPVPWLLGLTSKTPIPQVEAADQVAAAELRFFTQQQMVTLARLSDVSHAADRREAGSGAGTDTDVPGFPDRRLAGCAQAGLQRRPGLA